MNLDREKFERDLRNLQGSFAVEGITISESTKQNLERIFAGKATPEIIVREILAKHRKDKS